MEAASILGPQFNFVTNRVIGFIGWNAQVRKAILEHKEELDKLMRRKTEVSILYPTPYTLHPKPSTLNPQPSTLNFTP